jgi:aminomethyltransferase
VGRKPGGPFFHGFEGEILPKATPLNALHRAAGARMVDFGGWDMPVHYGSQIEEHHAVRRDAGIFDVAHMQAVDVEGPHSREFLRYALANDVDKLKAPGKALYTCMLNESGGVVDDLIAYFFRDDCFRIVVNAGTAEKDLEWLAGILASRKYASRLHPRRDLAILAVQGPRAREVAWNAFPGWREESEKLAPFNAVMIGEAMVARTGYTGEDGFEVMVPAEARAPRALARATPCAWRPA